MLFDKTIFILSRKKLPVHVVVDPVLGKVLRPHQREVNPFFFLLTQITLSISRIESLHLDFTMVLNLRHLDSDVDKRP